MPKMWTLWVWKIEKNQQCAMVSAAQMAQLRSISGNTKFGDDVEWTGANRVSRSHLFFEHAAAATAGCMAPPSPRPVTAPGRPCRNRAARRSTWVGFRSSLLFCRVPCCPRLIRQASHPSQAGRGACRRCPPEKSMGEGSGQQYAPVWYR